MSRQTLRTNGGVPPDVAARAEARRLGAHLAAYRPHLLRRPVAWALALAGSACLVGALAWVHAGVWPAGLASTAFGVLFLSVLARTPGFSGRFAARRVDVFEHGFIESDHGGPRVDFRWESISSVCQQVISNYTSGIHTGTNYLYTVRRDDGVTVKLTQVYEGIAALGETIAQHVAQVQLPRAIAAIEHGETVTFGDLSLNSGGLGCPGRGNVPWSEVEHIRVDRGYVCMRRAGKWRSWSNKPASQIPNLFVFLTLADLLRARAPGSPRLNSS